MIWEVTNSNEGVHNKIAGNIQTHAKKAFWYKKSKKIKYATVTLVAVAFKVMTSLVITLTDC